jgi:hypothetical protein
MRLNGKIAVITGASLGIDRVTEIIPMTARGASPRPNRTLLRQVAPLSEGTFWQAPAVTSDMTKPKDIDRIVQGASRCREAADPRG